MAQVQNNFAVDQPAVPEITDINNPPRKNYNPFDPKNRYPRMLYHHDTGRVLTVANEKEEKASVKRGYQLKPSPGHDYSNLRGGIAPTKLNQPKAEEEMSAADLAALDESDKG